MEYTRGFRVEVRVYRDTNKATYDETETFDSYEAAAHHLLELARHDHE